MTQSDGASGSQVPDDPLEFIRDRVSRGRIFWTYHVNMRLSGRSIERISIVESVSTYEVIESYPRDKYLPSYLVLANHSGQAFHVLFAADVVGDNVRVITAYRPEPKQWAPDLKSRRRSP